MPRMPCCRRRHVAMPPPCQLPCHACLSTVCPLFLSAVLPCRQKCAMPALAADACRCCQTDHNTGRGTGKGRGRKVWGRAVRTAWQEWMRKQEAQTCANVPVACRPLSPAPHAKETPAFSALPISHMHHARGKYKVL